MTSTCSAYNIDDQFTLLNGSQVSFSQYEGKLLFVEAFYTGCGYCIDLHPILVNLFESYGSTIQMVSLAIWPNRDTLQTLNTFNQEYPIAWDLGLDSDASFKESYGITGTPTSFLFDSNGNQLYVWNGLNQYAAYADVFDIYIANPPPATNSDGSTQSPITYEKETEGSLIGDLFGNPIFKTMFLVSIGIMVYFKLTGPSSSSKP